MTSITAPVTTIRRRKGKAFVARQPRDHHDVCDGLRRRRPHRHPHPRPAGAAQPPYGPDRLLLAAVAFFTFSKLFQATEGSSEPRVSELVGLEAEVITPIPAQGLGRLPMWREQPFHRTSGFRRWEATLRAQHGADRTRRGKRLLCQEVHG